MTLMKTRTITRNDIETLLPLFAKNFPEVELSDELEYFDELDPKDWVLAEREGSIIGYIRHFPDATNGFSSTEYYFSEEHISLPEIETLTDTFMAVIPEDIGIRFSIPFTHSALLPIFEKHFYDSESFHCFEYFTDEVDAHQVQHTRLAEVLDCDSITEALLSLGSYDAEVISKWIEQQEVYTFEFDGSVIGACYIHTVEDIEIEMIGIATPFQEKGHGTLFVKELLSTFKVRGADRVFLKVDSGNGAAIRLYQKCGFALNTDLSEVWFRS